jgi:3-phenylpropionate/trans-cinnamate dioxygenase ferredoxin reductase component
VVTKSGVIVVGSGPAGVAAAESFREHDSRLPLRIFTADIDLPYARPPLSKEYLRGQTDDVELHSAQWFDDRKIELNRGAAVDRLDLGERALYVGDERHSFDTLILTCGAAPVAPPIQGGQRALLLRSLAEATALRNAANAATSAVVIGSGFIGCEAAASLALRGVPVIWLPPNSFHKRSGSAARPPHACAIW